MVVTLDRIDRIIVNEMYLNCRASYRYLAQKTGLSPNAAKNRLARLIEGGLLSRPVVNLRLEMIDAEYAIAIVYTDGTENSREFVSQIGEIPMVWNVSALVSVNGGAYLVWSQFSGSVMQAELGALLRGLAEVQEVELYTVLKIAQGNKVEFSKIQLRVLRCLIQDPRMQISELAQMTGMAPKTVRRALKELTDSGALWFSYRFNPAAAGLVDAFVRINWIEKMISADELIQWLNTEFSEDLWYPWVSTSNTVMFADFVVESLLKVEQISNHIREAPFVKSTSPLVATSNKLFEKLTETRLKAILDSADI